MAVRPKKPPLTDTSTRKLFALTYRTAIDAEWLIESLEMTAFLVTPAGALTLFLHKTPLRCLAPGYWADLTLITEEKETRHAETHEAREEESEVE